MVVVKKESLRKVSDEEQSTPAPPDGGWGWMVVFASFMIHVIADGVTYTFGIFYSEFLKHFGESRGTTAWVASIMVGTTYCIGPIASGLTNKYGCRAVTIAGAILATLGLMISTVAPNVSFLFFSIGICTGAGFGLMYLPSIVSVTCYFEKKRAFATGMAVCGSGMGTFALAPFTEYLVLSYGWKGAMLIIAGLVLNCAVFGALFRPLEPPPKKKPSIRKPDLPKLIVSKSRLSLDNSNPAATPLMVKANGHAIIEESPQKKKPEDTNGYVQCMPLEDVDAKGLQPSPTYSSADPPSPDRRVNGISREFNVVLNGKKDYNISHARHSLIVTSDFFRRKVEGSPLSSFVCSSSSLAQTHKELQQLESSSSSQNHTGGLMYRKDIFYSGSLLSISKFRSNPNISYSSVMPVENYKNSSTEKRGFSCCPKEIRDALLEMTDFSLFRDPIFLMFSISNFLTSIGFNVPYVYTKDRVADMGIADKEDASYLLAIIGISNTVGRVTLGYLSDRACVNRLWIYNISLIICGLATALSCYAGNYSLMATYCATFGATAGAYVSLTSVILVDLLGLDKLTNAFGLLLVFEGVSCLLGPPITGWLYDGLGSYDPGFYVSGSMIAMSGLMLFLVPCISKPPKNHDPVSDDVPKMAETSA